MNREILFRGYNLKNKKWLYGYYFVNRGQHFITPDGTTNPLDAYEDFIVDESSIGQYTGILDAKGNKIFEGDILREKRNADKHIVKYSEKRAAFADFINYASPTFLETNAVSKIWGSDGDKTIISNTYETPVTPSPR